MTDWGRILSSMITACEQRVASYKQLLRQHRQDEELRQLFRESKTEEEYWLDFLRSEKTAWNQGLAPQSFYALTCKHVKSPLAITIHYSH